MNVWKLILHHEKDVNGDVIDPEIRQKMLSWSLDQKRIAIGWGKIGDIAKYAEFDDPSERIAQEIGSKYPHVGSRNREHGGYSLWNFFHVVKEGDLVILVGKGSHRKAVMRIGDEDVKNGDYFWEPEEQPSFSDYQHQRRATKIGGHKEANKIWNDWKNGCLGLEGGSHCTLTRLILNEEYRFP